jgi:zinc/manganese transport system substrate-binding protein
MINRRQALAAAVAATLAGLLAARPARAAEKLKVLATFSILGDFARNVGGDHVEVASLVGPNGDAHVYSPAPADARKVADAKVVIANGLGFEGWMGRLVKASGGKAALVVATDGIEQRLSGHGQGYSDPLDADPHAWQSVTNAFVYVANIRDALIAADPAGRADYEANTAAYLARLAALDQEVRAAVAKIPAARRRVISTHDAFGYFEQAYGINFIAPLGVSTDAEPSARDVARIITQIRREKIRALFLENVIDPRLMLLIAKEAGARIGGKLYSDALTDAKGEAPTYIELMRHNIGQMTAALMG